MLRASLTALGFTMLLLFIVGLVDDATWWLTWADGLAGVLTLMLVPVTRPRLGPVGASAGPGLLGLALTAMFIVGLATRSSAWLVWFTGAFAAGYLLFAAFAFAVRAVDPQLESRRPIEAM